MEGKSGNRKIILVIIFAIVAIVLAYAFTVIYFFYISPYDISMRLKIFPLLSDEAVAEQYLDAVVEIDFTATSNEELPNDTEEIQIFGVNVRQDGYVIASYHEFDFYKVENLKAISNEGGVYDGQIIFSDEAYNLTIIKLTSSSGNEVNLPYVKLGSGEVSGDVDIISVQVAFDENDIKTVTVESGLTYEGTVTEEVLTDSVETGGYVGVEYVLEECFAFDLTGSTSNSFIFTKYGTLLGIFSGYDEDYDFYYATTVSLVNNVFEDVVAEYESSQSAYSSDFLSAFVVLDSQEVYLHSVEANKTGIGRSGYYYVGDGDWTKFSANMKEFISKIALNSSFEWMYLVSDFSYGAAEITEDSVLTEISVNGTKTTLTSKVEFATLAYSLKSGDEVTIYYYAEYGGALDAEITSVTFTI